MGALVGLAVVAGSPGAVAARGTPPDRHCRPATWIQGLTENRTDARIVLAQEGLGLTNQWCKTPDDDVQAHASDSWRVGDASGSTELLLVYLLDNGDQVLFRARVVKDGPTDVGCSYVEVVRPPRTYECQAEIVGGAVKNLAFVRFSLLPLRR